MSNAERELERREPIIEPQAPCGAVEVKSLLSTIADQIAEADRRHASALADMQERLSLLRSEAQGLKSMPQELSAAVERIEDNMTMLADRMGKPHAFSSSTQATAPEAQAPARFSADAAPAPLRSAMPASGPSAPAAANRGIDPFDIVDSSNPDVAIEPWDESAAEALTRVYEGAEPAAESAFEHTALAVPAHEAPVDRDPAPAPVAVNRHVAPDDASDDLEARFANIAMRLEQSIAGLNPDAAFAALDQRFGEFEERLGTALGEIATRADLEGLAVLEQDMIELARRLEETQQHLSRLDSIELQLQEVALQLSDERLERFMGQPAAGFTTDAEVIADRVATEAAARLAEMGAAGSMSQGSGELRRLIEHFMDERRLGEEHTATMLDTMQQALIRVLDRMDAMELAQFNERSLPKPQINAGPMPAVAVAFETGADAPFVAQRAPAEAFASAPPLHEPQSAMLSPAAPAADLSAVATAIKAEMAASESLPSAMADPSRDEDVKPRTARSTVDKLRQDFIADARRAKEKAAAQAAEDFDLKAVRLAPPVAAAAAPPGRKSAAAAKDVLEAQAAEEPASRFSLSLSPKLIAGIMVLVVALGGALLLKSKLARPKAIETPIASEPAIPQPAKSAAPDTVAGDPAGAPASQDAPGPGSEESLDAASPGGGSAEPEAAPEDGALNGNGEEAIEPEQQSMVIDGAVLSVPTGINLRRSEQTPSGAELVRLRQNENVAEKSDRIAAAMTGLTPATFMPDHATGPAAGTPATGATSAPIEMPPLTVGPNSLRLAAANGDPSAQFEVGTRLAEGKGTNQNFKEAMRWYQRSASQGFAQAQYRLGTHYERGLGVKKDAAKAEQWYQRAATGGNVKAMHNLAVIKAGQNSGAPDYTAASEWFKQAAERGLADSQFNLAVLFENGLGVGKDKKQAYKWYALAARSGDAEAIRRRDDLKKDFSATERGEADQMVDAFVPASIDSLANDQRAAGEAWKRAKS